VHRRLSVFGGGPGESTTDLAWDGHALIYEKNELLAEAERFPQAEQIITGDIDLERLTQERMRATSFQDAIGEHRERLRALRRVPFSFAIPGGEVRLQRRVPRFPYVPDDPKARDERCYEAYNIQVHGLMKRLESTGIRKIVIGVSGGLDSTHALIVAAKTMDRLGLPRENILAYTMPGFATSEVTLRNAHGLMRALQVTGREIDIKPSCLQMLRDIGHPFSEGRAEYDVTFENVQAGERTSHLFRLANLHNGLVLGTGDLSELALGWATYGVGDHMSHYNVNASVPKTLIQHLLRWVVGTGQFDPETSAILTSILETEISPELVPHTDDEDRGQPAQSTQARIGPYELQDFNLYYISRYGLPAQQGRLFEPPRLGGQNRAAIGPTVSPTTNGANTTLPPSNAGSMCSCSAFSRSASSSARPCPTAPRSAPAARCHHAATGAPPATPRRPSGSKSCEITCPIEPCRKPYPTDVSDEGLHARTQVLMAVHPRRAAKTRGIPVQSALSAPSGLAPFLPAKVSVLQEAGAG
jgi:NAD+ synthetase